ncbi:hypothetical protein N0V86_002233 [Didymella sp. IMI 355093]|nr:hypothetical protein N0V86_002233 [Didymella sp. IMI 355093]
MSSISSTPRRPSTAQTSPFSTTSTRPPYEAAEALLWERQNARANTHLHAQMKELQAVHSAYDARISATEAVAEAAEAAVSKVRDLQRKVDALEADERESPFVSWVKEAVGQLQISVDGMKGLRQRVSALDGRMERLGEDVETVRDQAGVVKGVTRRLEGLEGERKEDGRRLRELEEEVRKLRDGDHRRDYRQRLEDAHKEVVEETYDEAQTDDNPLAVFYGIDTQSPVRRQESLHRRQASSSRRQDRGHYSALTPHQGRSASRLESPQRRYDDTQPPDEDIARPKDDIFNLLEAVPEIEYGWENTQQFKDMQKELATLREMCRTQDPKNSNETADTTQCPQDTLIVGRETNVGFSEATTETEADPNDAGRFYQGAPRGSVGAWR